MEALLNQSKRKKRKTRKCLDEMWKRSRTNFQNNNSTDRNVRNRKENTSTNKQRNCITTGRLTLQMFPKAVCSETITRPLLVDVKKPSVNKNIVDESPEKSDVIEENNMSTSITHQKASHESDNCIQYVNISDSDETSSDSLILFSPIEQPKNRNNNCIKSAQIKALSSSSNSESNDYHIYKTFMDKLPEYIRNDYPDLNKGEFITNAMKQLQNIQNYLNGTIHEPSKNNVFMKYGDTLMRYNTSNKRTIMENPMEYIRYGYLQHYCDEEESSSDSDSSNTDHCIHSPFASSPNIHSILSQTPEYTFYPHKLNE